MVQIDDQSIRRIGSVLNDKNRPLKERFRALFTLKNIGGPVALESIFKAFEDDSALLKHELAYCMGQMQDPKGIPMLIQVLEDVKQEPMVRHEAAEALGAIGNPQAKAILQQYSKDPVIEVAETCQIALARLNWLENRDLDKDDNPYASVDPSPASNCKDIQELKKTLLDNNETLFNRYRAMFSLRNLRTDDATIALAAGLKGSSALFRHEVAFVLGQLQHECSVPYLAECLNDTNENEMVRHECAEALGAIATEECIKILEPYLKDSKRVVKESCEIALDMCEYENSPEFQYANGLAATIQE